MSSRNRTGSPNWGMLTFTCCTMLVLGLFVSANALAQSVTPVDPPDINHCIEEAVGEDLNCTANDVSLSILTVSDPDAECTETAPGSGIFEATVNMQAQLIAGAKERWDIGMFIATDGGDARTGECYRNYLPGLPYADLSEDNSVPGSDTFGDGTGPFYDGEQDEDPTDQCGDLPQGITFYYDLRDVTEGTGLVAANADYSEITIVCQDSNDNGTVDVNTCTSWDNSRNNHCSNLYEAFPNTVAKCNCELTETNLRMPAFLTVEKICDPTDDDGTFEVKVDGEVVADVTECGDTSATIVIQIPSSDADGVVEATVSETDPGSNYETPVIGGDCDTDGTVSLESGDEKHCTVTNTRIICPSSLDCSSFDGVCGIASCDPDGAPNNCDIITYSSSTTICRLGSGDSCDPDESCTGTSVDCPADVITSATTVCNPGSGDVCDPDESCTGVAGQACPSDSVAPASTICNAGSGDICDPDESCTGTADEACPSDTVASASTICNAGSGDICDPDESCTGVAGEACPSDTVAPASTVCNTGSGDICDPDESCTGVAGEACPSDVVASLTTVCREGTASACDPDDSCTGVAGEACPTHEPEFCPTGEGCSPGFWRTHTSLWDGVGDDDVTDTITTETLWDDDLGIPSCDGVNLTIAPNDELGDTIVLKKNSSNTLYHFTACLIGADSIDGFAFQDLNALIADMQVACAEGGEALAELREACTAANFHDEITVFCPFN